MPLTASRAGHPAHRRGAAAQLRQLPLRPGRARPCRGDRQGVAGITDGTYFLVSSGDKQDYLCSAATYSANGCVAKICNGQSLYNSCFTFSRRQRWLAQMDRRGPRGERGGAAPWRQASCGSSGDVVWGQGTFFNSVLVSSNPSDGREQRHLRGEPCGIPGRVRTRAFRADPSQLCDLGRQVMKASQVGNIGMLAGSYRNGSPLSVASLT